MPGLTPPWKEGKESGLGLPIMVFYESSQRLTHCHACCLAKCMCQKQSSPWRILSIFVPLRKGCGLSSSSGRVPERAV